MKKIEMYDKGITLIALVITIIVLIILAGISINALTGNNGIIKEANDAKSSTERARIQEEFELATVEALKNNISTVSEMIDYLQRKFPDMEVYRVTDTYVRFDYKGEDIVVDDNGNVTVIEKVEPENTEDWDFTDGSLSLKVGTTYNPSSCDTIVIPNYYNGEKVNRIISSRYGEAYLSGITNINKLVVSDGIEEIDGTFTQTKLQEIYLSKTLKTVKKSAFAGSNIEKIVIPKSVEIIERYGFHYKFNKIYCEIQETDKPSGWDEEWTSTSSSNIIWGYNQ